MLSLLNLKTTKDVTTNEKYHEINNNTLNKENIKDVTTDITNIQYGNRIQGRLFDLDNHYNAGHESFGLMNLKTTKDVTTNEKYHEINNNTLNKENIKDVTTDITNIHNGNRIQGRLFDLDNHYNAGYESFGLQNLGMFDSALKGIGSAAKVGGDVWKVSDPKSFEEKGGRIMGGIETGAGGVGDMNKEFGFDKWSPFGLQNLGACFRDENGKLLYCKEYGLMNLKQKPTTAIVATQEEAMALINLNRQLEQPYEIKGAYLI